MDEGHILTQPVELGLGENAHADEVIAIGNGGEQGGKQDIAEGMKDLSLSARVREAAQPNK